jgi:hypothetical protein
VKSIQYLAIQSVFTVLIADQNGSSVLFVANASTNTRCSKLCACNINGIDERDMMEEMEPLLVDNRGTNSDGFVGAVNPCLKYATGSPIQGEQSSAPWAQFAFHDFVTADLEAGTG